MSSTVRGRRIAATLPVVPLVIAAFLAGGFYESTYSLLAAVVWLGVAVAAALRPVPRPASAWWALAAFGLWTALSALWGPAGPALRVAPLVALYAGVLLAAQWVEPRPLLRATWAACVLVCAAALVGWVVGVGERERLDWPVTYSNGLGLVAVSGVLLSLRFGRSAAVLCALTAVFTFSRSALLAGAAGLVVLLALRRRIPRWAAVAGAAAAVTLALMLAEPLAARFTAPAPDEGDARRLLDVSGHGRTELWRAAWDAWFEAPLLGRGAGTYARARVEETGELSGPANAHSLYLETLAELGPLGLMLLVSFVGLLLVRLTNDGAAGAVVVAWALHAAVDWDWQLPAATLPAILAAGALLHRAPTAGDVGVHLHHSTGLAVSVAALALGVAAGLHGLGAALLEERRTERAERFLPFDARPAAARGDVERACVIDGGELLLRRLPGFVGCPRPP